MGRTKGAVDKQPRRMKETADKQSRKDYDRKLYQQKKEQKEMDEINGAGVVQKMERLNKTIELTTIELIADDDLFQKMERLNTTIELFADDDEQPRMGRGRPKGAVDKQPRRMKETADKQSRKDYDRKLYQQKKEQKEMDEINGAGVVQKMERLNKTIELFADDTDIKRMYIKKMDKLQKGIAMAEMEYAYKTCDYSGLCGYKWMLV